MADSGGRGWGQLAVSRGSIGELCMFSYKHSTYWDSGSLVSVCRGAQAGAPTVYVHCHNGDSSTYIHTYSLGAPGLNDGLAGRTNIRPWRHFVTVFAPPALELARM